MTLLEAFLSIVGPWRGVFPQQRTTGGSQRSWSAEYFLYSRCKWEPQRLFEPILERALPFCRGRVSARALPIRFEEVSRVKRPGKKATPQMQRDYAEARKRLNLSRRFVAAGFELRSALDAAGGRNKTLVLTGDGSFCNRTCFSVIPERSVLLVRARKDAGRGGRRGFSMTASDADCAIRKSPACCGGAAPSACRCG